MLYCSITAVAVESSSLANPATALPDARIAIGTSYHLGGYSLTNSEIPSLFNRIHGRIEYAPFKYVALGLDAGVTNIEVDRYNDSIGIFHGKFGFSGGGHLKLSTPAFFNNTVGLIAIVQATYFTSKNDRNAAYSGEDGTGTVGLQFRIPGFGFISVGPWVYIIQGNNRGYDGETGFYSNTDNIRGWVAIDYFPKLGEVTSNKPYISLEFSISPKATYSEKVAAQGFSVSISIGAITKRLYGVESDVEWNP